MKNSQTKPPLTISRAGSLLHRLQHAPRKDEQTQTFLDQLMIFLDDPPHDVLDRWKEGAKMCAEWGIPCSGASVWRLYRSYALQWRQKLAHEAHQISLADTPEELDTLARQLIATRTFELLANPDTPVAALLALARIQLRKSTLEFTMDKYQVARTDERIEKLEKKAHDAEAGVHMNQLMCDLYPGFPAYSPLVKPQPPSDEPVAMPSVERPFTQPVFHQPPAP